MMKHLLNYLLILVACMAIVAVVVLGLSGVMVKAIHWSGSMDNYDPVASVEQSSFTPLVESGAIRYLN